MGEADQKSEIARLKSSGGRGKSVPNAALDPNATASPSPAPQPVAELRERVSALEAELAIYHHALDSLREEMQSFAYSVSHDLRAPVRAIGSFSRILAEDFSGELSGEAKNFLNHVVENSERLGSQIDDLLLYYRLGRNPPRRSLFNPAPLISEVFAEQKALMPGLAGELVVGDVPEVFCDPDLFRQVFAQLFSNSLKALAGRPNPKISVTARKEEGARTFTVEDNGIGFEMGQSEKLFQVFQKLHPLEEFPGNGIGLAIVKRITSAHGGCVRAESIPGEGARFILMFPHPPAQDSQRQQRS